MSEKQAAVSIDIDLTKPVTVLVEKIANAVGVAYEPTRIKRHAKAEAEAKIILAKAQVKATSIEERAVRRLVLEESKKQNNMESIIGQAIPQLDGQAKPEDLDDDWITNFFEKSRNVSDQDMQAVWSRLLAGEANRPGSYSKRTINLLAELDKSDAALFTMLANFTLIIPNGGIYPYVNDVQNDIYQANGIDFSRLQHLDSLGLIKFSNITGYKTYRANQKGGNYLVVYQGRPLLVTIPDDKDSELHTGHVMYTQQGEELFRICAKQPIHGFAEYFIDAIEKSGLNIRELRAQ